MYNFCPVRPHFRGKFAARSKRPIEWVDVITKDWNVVETNESDRFSHIGS